MAGHEHHIVPPRVYWIVYVILVVLLGLTYWAAGQNFQPASVGIAIAMFIAIVKAALVVLFFMQVLYSTRLTWVWAGLGFAWLFFLGGIMLDYIARPWMQDGKPF